MLMVFRQFDVREESERAAVDQLAPNGRRVLAPSEAFVCQRQLTQDPHPNSRRATVAPGAFQAADAGFLQPAVEAPAPEAIKVFAATECASERIRERPADHGEERDQTQKVKLIMSEHRLKRARVTASLVAEVESGDEFARDIAFPAKAEHLLFDGGQAAVRQAVLPDAP